MCRARVVYPTQVYILDMDRQQVVFYIAGWMLSQALTRVKRDGRLGPSFIPFVNVHKYDTQAAFLLAHPSLEGLELEVADRNVCWQGKGLFYAFATFFEFVYALERGYRHALKNPVLLATFLGDLPTEIFNVVSSAPAVKEAWANCVQIVRGGGVVEEDAAGKFDGLFTFMVMKWHRCRIGDYTKRMSKVSKSQKDAKAGSAAKRDELKIVSRKGGSKSGVTHVGNKALSEKEKSVALAVSNVGSRAFSYFSAPDLKGYIKQCGGADLIPKQMKAKSKRSVEEEEGVREELREILRKLCPGVGEDEPVESVAAAV